MLTIQTQLTSENMEGDLDRQDIIRDIMNKKLPFMSDEFYKAEIKKQKKDPKFRMKFDDLLQALSDKVRTMKAQGVSSKKDDAKIASLESNDNWKKKAAASPKSNPPSKTTTIKCFFCNASHPLERCNKLRNMPIEKRTEVLKKDGRCFRCLGKDGHIAKNCQSEGFKCANTDCGYNHPTILCGLRDMYRKRQEEKAAQASDGNQKTNRNNKNGKESKSTDPPMNDASSIPSTSSAAAPGTAAEAATTNTHNVNNI